MSHEPDTRLARYDDFRVGQRASFTKTIGEADIALFVGVTGDVNPLHVDERFAASTFFGSRIAHGLRAGALISTVIGTRLPGTGAIYRSQAFSFLRPTRIGDTLTAWVEVRAVEPGREIIELATGVDNQRGERVLEGPATVSLIRS
jgi:3-hydroxybutyryl-CoA dehydratase